MKNKKVDEKDVEEMTKAFTNIFEGLLSGIDKEAKETWDEVINKLELDNIKDLDSYSHHVLFPLDLQLKEQIAKVVFGSDDYDLKFLANNYYYVERHFRNIFTHFEGNFACADKSRTVINKLFKHYKNGEEIEFDYDAEYTYHLPQAVMRDPKDVIEFYQAVKRLHDGHYDLYIKFMGIHLPQWHEASKQYIAKLKKEAEERKTETKP